MRDTLGLGRVINSIARSASGVFIGVPAVVVIARAHATRIFGVAFPLALMARNACLPGALALGDCRRHDSQVGLNFKASCCKIASAVDQRD